MFIIGVENGIVQVGDKWVDLAVVVVLDSKGESHISTSTGVVFDSKYVEAAKQKGFEKVTVGSVMASCIGMSQEKRGREKREGRRSESKRK